MENLESLSRKELQALAKSHGLKANLSSAELIAKLRAMNAPEVEQITTVEPPKEPLTDVSPAVVNVTETAVTETFELPAPEQPTANTTPEKDFAVGDEIEASVAGNWAPATIRRINKKTIRVYLAEEGSELTVKPEEVRARTQQNSSPDVQAPVDSNDGVAICNGPAVDTALVQSSEVPVPSEVAAEPAVEAVVPEVAETLEAEVSAEQPSTAPPTPMSAVGSVGWNSCSRFSLQDSAVKAAPAVKRRNARRSAMKELAEIMKQEIIQEVTTTETEEVAPMEVENEPAVEAAIVAEEMTVEAPVEEQPAPAVEPAVEAPATELPSIAEEAQEMPTMQEAPVPVESAVIEVPAPAVQECAPTPAVTVPAPTVAPTAAATKDVQLPRMTKAQAMRVDAIQKKISTSEALPAPSTAFTINAKPTPSAALPGKAAHTPSYRSSICTSAPSSALHSINRAKQTTPQVAPSSTSGSGRLSIQISGGKRKVSDSIERDRSSISLGPDFKRMHNKQFNTLKSIAECVDQDKTIGARMSMAMESALNKPTPSINATTNSAARKSLAPFKAAPTAEVTKPAANPFSKVISKATSNTPGKPKQAGSTPAAAAPRPAHSGSSNIVKSRTVMSFVPSGNGGNKVTTSFTNNENAGPSSGNITSFLKTKDSGSASMHKHRSVVVVNSAPMNHGTTQQRLQMF